MTAEKARATCGRCGAYRDLHPTRWCEKSRHSFSVTTAIWAEVIRAAQEKAWDEGARKQGQYVGPVAATQLNPYRRQA